MELTDKMIRHCFLCNAVSIGRNSIQIFSDDSTVSSGKKLSDVIGEILDRTIKKSELCTAANSSLICRNCHKSCKEYDEFQQKLQGIKSEILEKFKKSSSNHKLDYGTIADTSSQAKGFIKIARNIEGKVDGKKIVLPASKLQPLPPNFVINVANLNFKNNVVAPQKSMPILTTPSSPLKLSVSSTAPAKSLVATSTNKITPKKSSLNVKNENMPLKYPSTQVIIDVMGNVSKITAKDQNSTSLEENTEATKQSTNTNDMATFNVNALLKDCLPTAALTSNDATGSDIENGEIENNDDQPMEIDEDCTYIIENKVKNEMNTENNSTNSGYETFDVNLLSSLDGVSVDSNEKEGLKKEFVLEKVEILNNDDENAHTLIMEGSNNTVIRMVSGKKFLVMPADDNNDNEVDVENYNEENGDDQDSNDESQIELQVSGDEETANAIIAAAKEQGGAFIKIESGEMYRVKSVQSKHEFDIKSSESEQLLQVVSRVGENFKCLLCDKDKKETISPAYDMMSHLKSTHGARIYICQICGMVIKKRSMYTQHLASHPKTAVQRLRLYGCNECGKRYGSSTLLNEHRNMHTGNRPYTCDSCHKSYASKYTLQAHLNTHTDRPRPYKCDECGKSFMTPQNLNQHVKTHSGQKDFECKVCGKAFGTQHNLEVHGIVHSGQKPFVCGVCGKAFARRVEVRDHMRIHTGERPFSCHVCGASFTQRSNLQTHIRATHLNDKRYPCDQCPKRFKRRRLLEYHIKASHTGERPLACTICSATFVYPEHYKKHLRIHSGEKPYECEVCGKTFNSRDNRNTHRFTHSDKKPYECVVCGAGYMRKQLLYGHMTTSGHTAESIVVNQPRVAKVNSRLPDVPELVEGADNGLEKSSLNLVEVTEEPTLLTIHNVQSDVKGDAGELVATNLEAAQLEIANQDATGMVRLVQIQLANGNSGWVAIGE